MEAQSGDNNVDVVAEVVGNVLGSEDVNGDNLEALLAVGEVGQLVGAPDQRLDGMAALQGLLEDQPASQSRGAEQCDLHSSIYKKRYFELCNRREYDFYYAQ